MKDYFNLKKSTRLLLALLMMLVGTSPTWAQETVTESFEAGLPDGWSINNTIQTSASFQISISSNYSHNSTGHSLYCQYSHYSGNYCYVVLPEVTGTISLYARAVSNTSYGYLSVYRYADGQLGTIIGDKKSKKSTSWGDDPWTFSLGEDSSQVAIVFGGLYVDDVTVTYPAEENPKPKGLSFSDITINSAVVSWLEGTATGWNLQYKAEADADYTSVNGLTTNSYTLTGLSDNTTYEVKLQAVYEGGNSDFITKTFTTLLAPISTFPWTENFNSLTSGAIPAGWDNSEGTTTSASQKWVYYSSGHDGSCVRFDSYNNSSNNTNFLKTPIMNFPEGSPMQLTFWYKNPKGGDFSVYISSDGGSTYTTELATGLTNASAWTEKTIDIPAEFTENVVIVFKGTSNYGGGDAYIYLDDVSLVNNTPAPVMETSVSSIAFGTITSESTSSDKTRTFTISNVGTAAVEGITVSYSGDDVISTSPTVSGQSIAAGGEPITITVTANPTTTGDFSGNITVSATGLDNIVIPVTASYAAAPATMAITLDEAAVGETVAFGNVGKQATKTFTVTNDGNLKLNVAIASNNTTDFTVSPSALEVAGGSSETFTVTFVYGEGAVLDTEKTANITVTPSNEGLDPVTFAVTGTRIEQWSEDFSNNTLPDGWEITNSTYWKIQDGVAKGSYSYGNYDLITPSLIVEEGKILTFDYRMTSTYRSLDIQYSKNNGDWQNYGTISYSGLTQDQWYTYTIEGLDAGKYKFRFGDSNYDLDNFQGFKRNMNDPKMGIYTDADCTVAATTNETKNLGFATTNQTATYYIKNDGTGTMTLSKGENPAGFTATLDKTSVAAGEKATLTITMPAADNVGYHEGDVVVTATDLGTFTVSVSGVVRDENKLYLDFTTDNIPSTWTKNSWSKNANGYINVGYTSSSMETTSLKATEGETLVVVAQQEYNTASYVFGVNYRKVGDEGWSSLIASQHLSNTEKTMLTATVAEAGNYQLQFVGNYARIYNIYGLSEAQEPVMAVYNGESLAEATYNFGNVSDEADAVKTFTVKNEGKAVLTGLDAMLSGADASHYSVEVSATELAVNATATVTVKQLKDNLGAHSATLTLSATGLGDKSIELSGFTYDHTKLFVDFQDNAMPEGWTVGTSWSVSSSSGNYYAQQSNYNTSSALVTTPLTVDEDETLTFQAGRYSSYQTPELKVRYTTDGGATWSDYVDYASQITSSNFVNLQLQGVPAGTTMVEFFGRYVKLDNISGFTATTAPVLTLTEGGNAVASGSTKAFGNLNAEATVTYTLGNTGNADLVSTLSKTGAITYEVTAMGEGVIQSENSLTIPAGKTATIVVTMPYAEPFEAKTGALTITSEGWVADVTVNYTATLVDPTALYEDFANNAKPEGWYVASSTWTFTGGSAHIYTGTEREMVTEQYAADGEAGKNVLSFDVKRQSTYTDGELKVYTSTNRKTWTLAKTITTTSTLQNQSLDALADGNYYVMFVSTNASIDNVTGLKKVTPTPEHDLYISASSIPTETKVPETSITATATVASLRANETGVYAKLFFDDTEVAVASAQSINKDATKSFTLTGNVPVTEKSYAAKIVVYYSDESVAFETLPTDVEVAHTRTLAITDFTRTKAEEEDDDLTANSDNQISPSFSVTVENTGSTDATPVVKVLVGETVVGTATADAAVAAGENTVIAVSTGNMSAGEGGSLQFTAKAFWTAEDEEAKATSASNVVINVTAAAPKFDFAVKGGDDVEDGDDVAFGLVNVATTKTFTITNNGNRALELVSIVAPEGYTATAVTEENKTIAVSGTLDIDVTLKAEQGRKNGELVFTYKVDATTNKTFTLNLSGRSIGEDTWAVAFDGTQTSIPSDWTTDGWRIASAYSSYPGAAYTYTEGATLMTPRLAATEGDELTFDADGASSTNVLTVEYSTDKKAWNDYATVATSGEQTFTAPADGNYYLRFTGRYVYLSNFVGFKLNPLEHDTEMAAASVPSTGVQYGDYTATVTLKENVGKAEEVTAKLYVGGEVKVMKNETITANGSTVVTLIWEPQTATEEAVKAYVEVTYAGGTLETEKVDLTIAAPYTLDETIGDVATGTYPALLLNRTFAAGWNTICVPFDMDVETVFGSEAKAYGFTSFTDGVLNFEKVETMEASKPYVLYVPTAISEPLIFKNMEITYSNSIVYHSDQGAARFQGTYAPIAAGNWPDEDGKLFYGLNDKAQIAKANTEKASIKGFRAYFVIPTSVEVKEITFDGLATGLFSIEHDGGDGQTIYDLTGRQLQKARRGVNIVNGKKVLVK